MADLEQRLLDWYALEGRDLPWRRTRDPYAILVSEVMLQQTQVERVVPRYLRWLERWPTAESLAAAPRSEVIREWQGLGYNRRAVNLHRAAGRIAEAGWPDDLTELAGVGRYTADAVARFALEAARPTGGRQRRPRPRANRRPLRSRLGARAHGSRGNGLPGARSPVRRLSARRGVPVARPPLRAAAQAGAVRGLLQAAPRADAATRRRAGASCCGPERRSGRRASARRPRPSRRRPGSPAVARGARPSSSPRRRR